MHADKHLLLAATNVTREGCTVSSAKSKPQKTEGNPKWILATGGRKENFEEFFNMITT